MPTHTGPPPWLGVVLISMATAITKEAPGVERVDKLVDRLATSWDKLTASLQDRFTFSIQSGQELIAQLSNGYGCWCNLGHGSYSIIDSRGQPVDALDEICKGYNQAIQCLHVDLKEINSTCDHYETDFNYDFTNLDDILKSGNYPHESVINRAIQNMCDEKNEYMCQTLLCTIETKLIRSIMHWLMDGHVLDEFNLHSNGFDFEDKCLNGSFSSYRKTVFNLENLSYFKR